MDFKKYKIKDIGEVVGGATPLTKDSDNYDGDISWITPNDLSNYKDVYINRGERNITAKGLKEIGNKLLPKGTVLFSSRAPIGYVAIANQELCTNQGFKSVIPNYELVTSEYLYYTLGFYKSFIEKQGSGTTFMEVSGATMENIELPIPALEEQRRISDTLIKIDKKIALNKRMNAELEAMAKQLYDYWFVQFDFPDENGNPYKSSGGKMVYNSTLKREIPAGWEVTSIGDLITTERGISYSTPNISSGNGVPMLNLATFMPGGGDYKASGLKHYLGDYPPSKVLKPYDLIMCNTQQTAIKFETDIIGRAMLVPDIFEGDIVFSHHVNIIKTENDDLKYYLLYLFNSDYYHKYISGYTNGTNILGLSFNGVSEYNLEIPPDAILKQFASLILDLAKKKSLIFKESSNLTHLRDSLLPMLMNGQVTVE